MRIRERRAFWAGWGAVPVRSGGEAGRGEKADHAGGEAGLPGRADGYRSAQCVQLRSAPLARPRDHMSGEAPGAAQPAGGRPNSCSPEPLPVLTMSICCCFFFRDYGSSKRKSGKGVSALFSLTSQLPARVPLILRRTFGGGGMSAWPAGTVVLYAGGCIHCPLPDPCPLSSLPLTPSFSSLVPLAPRWESGCMG